MKRSSHTYPIEFGTKTWFQCRKMQEVSEKEIKIFLKKTETREPITQIDIKCAYEAYRAVTSGCNVAYLHKKNVRSKLKDSIIENIKRKCKTVVANRSFPVTDSIDMQEKLENEAVQMVLEGENLDFLSIEVLLKQASESISGTAEMISSYLLFSEIDDTIKQQDVSLLSLLNHPLLDGRLYQPIITHSWIINLAWMLAHFHHGSEFLICSDVLGSSLHRGTEGYTHQISGFAREIAVALECGYEFKMRGEQIVMVHNNPANLENISLSDIAMTQEACCEKYAEAVVVYKSIKSEVKEEEEKASKNPRISSVAPSNFFCPLSSSRFSLKSSGNSVSDVSTNELPSATLFSSSSSLFSAMSRSSRNPDEKILATTSIEALGAGKRKARKRKKCQQEITSSRKTITPMEVLLLNSHLPLWPFTTNFPLSLSSSTQLSSHR